MSRSSDRGDVPGPLYVPYPEVPRVRGAGRVAVAWRRSVGYHHVRQGTWQRRVLRAVQSVSAPGDTVLLHNDPEMAGWLGRRLPGTTIAHVFHNQNRVAAVRHPAYRREVLASFGVSDSTARWNQVHLGLPPGAVETLYAGVDASFHAPASRPPEDEVVFVGLLNENKAPHLVLEAVRLLPESCRPARVRVIGAPHYGGADHVTPYEGRLRELAAAVRADGVEVLLDGFVSRTDLPERLLSGTVGVVPSIRLEAFGMVALEMMASGMPVLVSRTGGLPETVGPTGLTFGPGDAGELARHLTAVLSTGPSGREALTRAAVDRAATFSWQATARQLVSRLEALRVPDAAQPR